MSFVKIMFFAFTGTIFVCVIKSECRLTIVYQKKEKKYFTQNLNATEHKNCSIIYELKLPRI